MAAARALLTLTNANGQLKGDPADIAHLQVFNGFKRLFLASAENLPELGDKMLMAASVCVLLGEAIGQTLKMLPPAAAEETLRLFLEELANTSPTITIMTGTVANTETVQ